MSPGLDLTGQRFGRLVAKELVHRPTESGKHKGTPQRYWTCDCDCGKQVTVFQGSLRQGKSQSCGCLSAERASDRGVDITGERFGRLVARELMYKEQVGGKHAGRSIRLWICDCDCGNQHTVSQHHLRQGKSKSCGCFDAEVKAGRLLDLAGQRFGRLVARDVVYRGSGKWQRRNWVCDCDCGGESIAEGYALREGIVSSCGCLRDERAKDRWNLKDKRFGHLIAIGREGMHNAGELRYYCRCDCGREKAIPAGALKNGTITHCGCLDGEDVQNSVADSEHKPYAEAILNRVISSYKSNAKKLGRIYNLPKDTAQSLLLGHCHYCGSPPCRKAESYRLDGFILVNGIDRMNSQRGYELDNVVTCCTRCNYMKWDLNHDEFIELVRNISNYTRDV